MQRIGNREIRLAICEGFLKEKHDTQPTDSKTSYKTSKSAKRHPKGQGERPSDHPNWNLFKVN